ncbi:MAG: hypothetical protein ACI88A_000040 [Paraglaciecola sp.]|jgi:hypothetical protein
MKLDTQTDKLFTKKFMFSMMIFLVLIAIQTFSLELLDMAVWLQVVVTLLPVTPLIWAFQIYRKRFRLLDEYMQRLTGEAFLWSMGIVGFLSFSYGMLEMKFALPAISLSFILPAIFGGHGLVLQVLLYVDSNEE